MTSNRGTFSRMSLRNQSLLPYLVSLAVCSSYSYATAQLLRGWSSNLIDFDFEFLSEEEARLLNISDATTEPSLAIEVLEYISIPVISALVGFGTNWLALKMTFYPINFFGVRLLGKYSQMKGEPAGCIGWQGIIPAKSGKMAAIAVDLLTTEVFDIKEIFQKIKPEEAALHLKQGFEESIDGIIDELSDKFIISKKTEWKGAEAVIKRQVTAWALGELPEFAKGFMKELVDRLDDVYDIKDMSVTEFTNNPQLLNDIFEQVGKKELLFIRDSGAYFGFLFGLVQLVVWVFYPEGWVLPVFGFIVGYATNWIALKMIFQPINPHTVDFGKIFCCGFIKMRYTFQGLFLKRQKEASIAFARKITGSVLHSENIWKHMLNGPKSDKFKELLDKNVDDFTERLVGYSKPLVKIYMGEREFDEMKRLTKEMSRNQIEKVIEFMHEYTDEALGLEEIIAVEMGNLPSAKFERVLHPVFEEDEFKLILVGALLGTIVGLFQLYVIFREN